MYDGIAFLAFYTILGCYTDIFKLYTKYGTKKLSEFLPSIIYILVLIIHAWLQVLGYHRHHNFELHCLKNTNLRDC